MKGYFLLLISFFTFSICSAQQTDTADFAYNMTKLSKVLSDAESAYQIKYSYIDSIVAPKKLTLAAAKYTLEQLNTEITKQTGLTVIKIDARYYSVYDNAEGLRQEWLREILVEGLLSKGINKTSEKVVISPQKLETLPGVTDADILFSLQQLPGVKSPNETASGLHVRGGTSDQNLVLWDGIRMYHPGHLFGMISGFNPNAVSAVHFYNKATDPKFGERISSVIDIKTSDKIPQKIEASAGLNALNADLDVRIPILKDKLGIELSGRKSYTEWLQTPTFNALAKKVFQNTNFKDFNSSNRFDFEDYSGKINYRPFKGTEISFASILIDNYLNFNSIVAGDGPRNQKMDVFNQGYSFNWKQQYSPKLSSSVLLYYSAYTFNYLRRQHYTLNRFEEYEKRNRITDSGLEANFNYRFTDKLRLDFGYQMIGNDLSHSFTIRNQGFEIDLDNKRLFNVSHVGYLQAMYTWGRWDFRAGARYNYYRALKANSFEPRAFVQRKLTRQLIWQATYEKKSQIMNQVRESVTNELSLENYVWLLSDQNKYPIQHASQLTTGLIFKTKSWLIDADVYYKQIDGITSLAFGSMYRYDTAIRNGNGFSKGFDVLVQKGTVDWRAWATYTYQDSQNKYNGLNSDAYFASNASIWHALNVSFYKKWNRYSVALGWNWHTGKPYTVLDADGQVVSFNKERLPNYHRLDISGTYQFRDKENWSGKIGFSVLNAYNQRIVISKEYERVTTTINDVQNFRYDVQDFYSLGITPNVFVRIML
jgi:hypothetical protein